MEDRRFIEETFPVKEISDESASEKSVRHGHISTFHIWWARRPLASSRATNFASLIPATEDQEQERKIKDFIVKLSKWENSLDEKILEEARKIIVSANAGKPPRVLDPFAGGGAIPLEAMRLGCETYAHDYNPVATLILKCTLEYPQKYASNGRSPYGLVSDKRGRRLLDDLKRWSDWVLKEAKKEIGNFYPEEKDGSLPVGFVWTRTVPCQNPSCGAVIPLIRQFWLAKKTDRKIALYPSVSERRIRFSIVGTGYEKMPKDFDPEKGTVSGAIATCLVCGSVLDSRSIRKLWAGAKSRQQLIVVILHKEGSSGKKYRIANDEDLKSFDRAASFLIDRRKSLMSDWGLDPIPDEPIHTPDNMEYRPGQLLYNFTPVLLYGMTKWGDLFNSRQKLALITFIEKIRMVGRKLLSEGIDKDYARALVTYLAVAVDRMASYNTTNAPWHVTGEKATQIFGRQALPMVWDYTETNPFANSFSWQVQIEWILRVIDHLSAISAHPANVSQGSATTLPYENDFFDAVLTDPPYYDNVPYADLSDFFYVWLKRAIGDAYPDLFSTPLTPKSDEAIAELPLLRGMNKEEALQSVPGIKTSEHFEEMLRKSFREIQRVLKPNGVCVLVYAHKSTVGWETLLNSLLDSGLVVTAAWPIHTEMKVRLRAKESAALASSIYMVARKFGKEHVGFYNDVRYALKKHLDSKLDKIWNEGVSGADFFIAAIGSSIEVFGKYDKVIDDEGNIIRAKRFLEDIRKIVTDYAVRQVLHNGFVEEINPMTRFYVLWRWAYGDARLEFDDAHKLAQGVGIDLPHEWNRGFIKKEKEFIRILGPEDRDAKELEGSKELIDVLHNVLLLWKKGKSDEIMKVLKESGFGKSDVFYRVGQAISESLPSGNKEKKLLEGFVQGKQRISEYIRKETEQRRLI